MEKLKKREFYIANEVNWEWLEQVGLVEAMNPYVTKIFMNEGVRITCIGQKRLFQLQKPVYKELCLEFNATIRFKGRSDAFDIENLTFCLGGE